MPKVSSFRHGIRHLLRRCQKQPTLDEHSENISLRLDLDRRTPSVPTVVHPALKSWHLAVAAQKLAIFDGDWRLHGEVPLVLSDDSGRVILASIVARHDHILPSPLFPGVANSNVNREFLHLDACRRIIERNYGVRCSDSILLEITPEPNACVYRRRKPRWVADEGDKIRTKLSQVPVLIGQERIRNENGCAGGGGGGGVTPRASGRRSAVGNLLLDTSE